ncbi:MAG: stage V sporulation protein AA [Lachnospiraceae bacterium]
MAGKGDTVYIKADRNVEVTKEEVTLGDVLQMECVNPSVVPKLRTLKLVHLHPADKKRQSRTAISVLKVIELIHREYPNIDVQNVGEQDFIVTYENQKTKGGLFHIAKTVLVVIISFLGAAFSIMAFNNDVSVTKMFSQIYELVTGTKNNGFTILEFTYSIGLIIGILTFFNHFGKKKFTVDPTPMEVEMRLYENDLQTTMIENFSREEKEIDVGKKHTSCNYRT